MIAIQAQGQKPFKDDSHCYWIGNQRLYSLSRVLRDLGLKPVYPEDPKIQKRVKEAALVGKLTEQYCVKYLKTGKSVTVRQKHTGSLRKRVIANVEAFDRWRLKYQPIFVDAGDYVWSLEDRVCWQRDLRVMINGRLTLVDIKCTSKLEKDWPLQLGCGLAYDQHGEHGYTTAAAILHLNPKLNKEGYRWIDKWPKRQLVNWWDRAIGYWKSQRDFNLLKGELGFDSQAVGFEVEDDYDF